MNIESKIANRLQPLMARASTSAAWAEIDQLEAAMRADERMKMGGDEHGTSYRDR